MIETIKGLEKVYPLAMSVNEQRNKLFDDMVKVIEDKRTTYRKYKEFLGKFQELARRQAEIENKMITVTKRLK